VPGSAAEPINFGKLQARLPYPNLPRCPFRLRQSRCLPNERTRHLLLTPTPSSNHSSRGAKSRRRNRRTHARASRRDQSLRTSTVALG
jgi:hypothetical protein